jgi:hypothetical protein
MGIRGYRVNSRAIDVIGYEQDAVLSIQFKNGKRYIYQWVTPEVFRALMTASSKGSFFASHIKEQYGFKSMEDDFSEIVDEAVYHQEASRGPMLKPISISIPEGFVHPTWAW